MASNLLEMASNLVASLAMPFVPSGFLLLVVRPGAPSSVLAPNSGLQTSRPIPKSKSSSQGWKAFAGWAAGHHRTTRDATGDAMRFFAKDCKPITDFRHEGFSWISFQRSIWDGYE